MEAQGAKLASVGDNLFAGVYNYLVERLEEGDPFSRTKVTAMMEKIKSQNAELKMLEQEAEEVEQRRNTAEKLEAAARKMVEERVIIVKNLTLLKDKIIEDLKLTRSV